jgi:hypothetical protein
MLRLHFPNRPSADIVLNEGLCPIVRHASGQILAGVSAVGMLLLARFCLDRRGLWLQISNDRVHVHVNGRPVRRMAFVRAGDHIHIDGQDIHVLGRMDAAGDRAAHTALLRGYGGSLHGRAFALDRNWVLGSSAQADIVVQDTSLPALYLRIQPQGEVIDLQVLAGGPALQVNGQSCTQSTLLPGDQICIADGLRLVVESPAVVMPPVSESTPITPAPGVDRTSPNASVGRMRMGWWWLLLAALVLGGALAALLLFGPR